MDFGERLRTLRTEKNMSMEEVGQHIGVGRANVYKYEHGMVKNIPPEKARKLAELFEVTVPYLMGWTDKRDADVPNPLNTIAVPNSEMFVKAYNVMTTADRMMLTEIFNRAYEKLKKMEEE